MAKKYVRYQVYLTNKQMEFYKNKALENESTIAEEIRQGLSRDIKVEEIVKETIKEKAKIEHR